MAANDVAGGAGIGREPNSGRANSSRQMATRRWYGRAHGPGPRINPRVQLASWPIAGLIPLLRHESR